MRGVPGVQSCQVNLARGRAVAQFDPAMTDATKIADAIVATGYGAAPEMPESAASAEAERIAHQTEHARGWLRRAVVGVALWLPVELAHWMLILLHQGGHRVHLTMAWLGLLTATAALGYVGSSFYRSAWGALKRGTSNMDTLIALGATVAYGYSVVALVGYLAGAWQVLPDLYFMEGTGLLALISLGHWLEARARQSAGSAIRELLDLAPATALRVLRGEGESGGQKDKETPGHGEARATGEDAEEGGTGGKAMTAGRLSLFPLVPSSPGHLVSSAAREAGSQLEEVPVAALHSGDRVLIRPGDRVPIDGIVVNGTSAVDESMLTGEPIPVTRTTGDTVIGGTINHDGRLIVRVTRTGSETALAQIVRLVETAQSSKPPVQQLADRIAAIFVPSVLAVALVTGIGWYLWGTTHHWAATQTWAMLAKAVCSVLIIACPCALGLAIPAAIMVGTGRGAKRGILIRDIDALQSAERIDTVVLDKTGTITQGKPAVVSVVAQDGTSSEDVLRLSAAAEQYSEHPLAKAITAEARARHIQFPDPDSFNSESGLGVVATVDGRRLLVGSAAMLVRHGLSTAPNGDDTASSPATRVYLAERRADGTTVALGLILISDEIKPDSVSAIQALHAMNLRTVLLSGDHEAAAQAIAKQTGIDDVRANVKPAEKAEAIRQLQAPHTGTGVGGARVAMVGDGINDAPALAQADLGIAIGSGSDVAKETGGIVLVSGSLVGVATAIRLSRATMRTIRQNLFLAFAYNVLAIPLAAFGLLNPLVAAAAMALSDVTVIGNALLLRRRKID